MIAKIIFRPAAEIELREAFEWYELRESGLGAEFMRCVDGCVQMIRRHPDICAPTRKHVRQAVLRRFPYSVMYFSSGDSIVVVSVFHSSRDPRLWKRRV